MSQPSLAIGRWPRADTPPEDLPPSYEETSTITPTTSLPTIPPPTSLTYQTPAAPNAPPPSYTSITLSSLPPAKCTPTTLTEKAQTKLLTNLLKTHPWPRTWGPTPTLLAPALRTASLHGALPLVSALLSVGAPLTYSTRFHARRARSAIHEAARGPEPRLAIMLARCCDSGGRSLDESVLMARDEIGRTALHFVAGSGRTDVCEGLVGLGAEVDVPDDEGRTPLFMACRYRRGPTMRYLVAVGADVGRVRKMWEGREGELGHWKIVEALLEEMGDEEVEGFLRAQEGARGVIGVDTIDGVLGKKKGEMQRLPEDEDQAASSGSKPRRRSIRDHDLDLNSPTWTSADPTILDEAEPEIKHFAFDSPPTSAGANPPRDFTSMWNSPQYVRWVSGIETVQDEVRAQRARLLKEAKYAD